MMKQASMSKGRKTLMLLIVLVFISFACNLPSPGNGPGMSPTSTPGGKNPPTHPAAPTRKPDISPTPTPTATETGLFGPNAKLTLEIKDHSSWTESGMTRSAGYVMSIPLEISAKGSMVGHGKAIMKMIDTGHCVGEADFEVIFNVTATGTDPITFNGEGSQTVISDDETCDGVKTFSAVGETSQILFGPIELPARGGAAKTVHMPIGASGEFSQTFTLHIQ